MPYIYSGNVVSEIATVSSLVADIIDKLSSRLDKEQLMDLRLILSELMINGCEHGNENNRRKFVSLDLVVNPTAINVVVSDEGKGIGIQDFKINPKNLSCSGRGLKIVKALCDEFRIEDTNIYCTLYR